MNIRLEQTEGGRLKQARHQLGMTLKEFAEKINYNDANLSKMERNLMAINDNVVKKLLKANINALVIKFGDEQKDINGTTYLFDDEDGNIALDGYKILNRFSGIKISEYKTEAKCQVRVIYSGNDEFFFKNCTIMFLDYFTPLKEGDFILESDAIGQQILEVIDFGDSWLFRNSKERFEMTKEEYRLQRGNFAKISYFSRIL